MEKGHDLKACVIHAHADGAAFKLAVSQKVPVARPPAPAPPPCVTWEFSQGPATLLRL